MEALVDAIPLGEPVDIVALLNAPLRLLTLAELLGVSGDLWPKLYDWTNAFGGEDDPGFRQSPEAMHGVKEMVRHASPALHMRSTATADNEPAGTAIRKGDKVVLWYASGDRDEAAFADPYRFDLTRGNIVHVSFGSGQHVCVGSRLAEMRLRVAFETLATRVTAFAVTGEPVRLRSNFINGLKTLRMELTPA